jgi:hypothetical protein
MLVKLWDKKAPTEKKRILDTAETFLNQQG